MNAAGFRLESFSANAPGNADLVRRQEVDDSFRKGLAEGRTQGASEAMRDLTAAIRALDQSLSDIAAIRAEAMRQTALDLMPILSEIVAALARKGESAGLEAALRQELLHLAGQVPGADWHLRCPPDMEQMVRRCATEAGLKAPDIRVEPGASHATIILDDGRSAFSNERVAQHFQNLISELQESYQ